jgi:hypothetical protein
LLVSPAVMAAPPAAGLLKTLEANRWKLDAATDAQGRRIEAVSPSPGRSFTFSFSGTRLSIQGGCHQMTVVTRSMPRGS